MRLQRLELVGFKSFAQKTILEFPPGMTAIVGPNGSGKSNIIDAIRWLLGERDAKNVRGGKVEDLIFAGSRERARAGLAQATLVFDNTDRAFPVDAPEVAVRRRVSRDGASQYFVNDDEVRLKDVVDFFAKARLGTKGLAVMGQGESDMFVRAAPRDRRVMLEEMLGLRQYELKRHEAEHKLRATRANMDKVCALIAEIAPHLKLLRRQTVRFAKHEGLANELRELEERYFRAQYAALSRERVAQRPEEERIEKERVYHAKGLAELESALGAVEKVAPASGKELEATRKREREYLERRVALERELARLEAELSFSEKGRAGTVEVGKAFEALDESRKIIRQALEEKDFIHVRALLKILLGKLDALTVEEEDVSVAPRFPLASRRAVLAKELKELEEFETEARKEEARITENLGAFHTRFRKAYAAVEEKKTALAALESQFQQFRFADERIKMREEELNHAVRQVMRRPEEFHGGEAAVLSGDERAGMERRMLRLRGELAAIGEIDPALMKEADETEARHAFLESQLTDLERAAKDLDALIKELSGKIQNEFHAALRAINVAFQEHFHLMFDGGKARLYAEEPRPRPKPADAEEGVSEAAELAHEEEQEESGIEIEVSIPRKKISGLEMLSGGERSLVSLAALFALISVSPPPFLVLDEVDAALDEANSRRFAELVKRFSKHAQFIVVTHNRATMEEANVLYGVTMGTDGTSKVFSLKFEEAAETVGATHG